MNRTNKDRRFSKRYTFVSHLEKGVNLYWDDWFSHYAYGTRRNGVTDASKPIELPPLVREAILKDWPGREAG